MKERNKERKKERERHSCSQEYLVYKKEKSEREREKLKNYQVGVTRAVTQ